MTVHPQCQLKPGSSLYSLVNNIHIKSLCARWNHKKNIHPNLNALTHHIITYSINNKNQTQFKSTQSKAKVGFELTKLNFLNPATWISNSLLSIIRNNMTFSYDLVLTGTHNCSALEIHYLCVLQSLLCILLVCKVSCKISDYWSWVLKFSMWAIQLLLQIVHAFLLYGHGCQVSKVSILFR